MLAWTWGRHAEALVDFGREIYTAWRLSAGDVLYRDIDYFNGPFSPYFNSLVFRVFGASLLHLQISNVVWWSLLCVLSYRLFQVMADRLAAFVALFVFITVFSFLQLNSYPIFNYVSPYAHEITQSATCAFGVFALLHRYLLQSRPRWLFASGVMLGIIFLMKVEVTLAVGAALTVSLAADLWRRRPPVGRGILTLLILIGGVCMPILIAWILLSLAMPPGEALRGVLGSWKYVLDTRLTNNDFYRSINGFDQPWLNTRIMFTVLGVAVAMMLPAIILAPLLKRKRVAIETRFAVATGCVIYVGGWIYFLWDHPFWQAAGRPLNLLTATTLVGFSALAIVRRKAISDRFILQWSFAVFAMLMLIKVLLTSAVYHYGFVLTAPAMSLFVMLVICWIPSTIKRAGGSAWIFRGSAMMLLGGFCLKHLAIYDTQFWVRPRVTIGTGNDSFSAIANTTTLITPTLINQGIEFLNQHAGPGDTLAMVPQGAMINFLTRRINPTGEVVLLPGEVDMFGEARILQRFRDHPPDWMMISQTNVSVFGHSAFGIDYAVAVGHFIREHYQDVTPTSWPKDSPLRVLRQVR